MAQASFEPGTSRSRVLRSTHCATLAGSKWFSWETENIENINKDFRRKRDLGTMFINEPVGICTSSRAMPVLTCWFFGSLRLYCIKMSTTACACAARLQWNGAESSISKQLLRMKIEKQKTTLRKCHFNVFENRSQGIRTSKIFRVVDNQTTKNENVSITLHRIVSRMKISSRKKISELRHKWGYV